MIITLSGPAASGKGTLARMLAKKLVLPHYDFGLAFRIIALLEQSYGMNRVLKFISQDLLTMQTSQAMFYGINFNPILHREEVGFMAAQLAAREYEVLESCAKALIRHEDFIVDGRTCDQMYPEADYKFYITAGNNERSRRRQQDGGNIDIFLEREALDNDRLKPSPDSLFINTEGKSQEESLRDMLTCIG